MDDHDRDELAALALTGRITVGQVIAPPAIEAYAAHHSSPTFTLLRAVRFGAVIFIASAGKTGYPIPLGIMRSAGNLEHAA